MPKRPKRPRQANIQAVCALLTVGFPIPYGTWDRGGGGTCVDFTYDSFFEEEF